MTKEDSITADHVMIKFNREELNMVTAILDKFLDQNKNVYKSCGIKTKKMERQLSSLHARLDTTFWNNFDEDTILQNMWGISLDKARYDE
jgi:hypothetical protein